VLGAQCAMWVVLVHSGVYVVLLQPKHWVNKSSPKGLNTQMMKLLFRRTCQRNFQTDIARNNERWMVVVIVGLDGTEVGVIMEPEERESRTAAFSCHRSVR
jgi:hypothetical protein